MKCSKAHKLILSYIGGELHEQDIKTLEDHMKFCLNYRTENGEAPEKVLSLI